MKRLLLALIITTLLLPTPALGQNVIRTNVLAAFIGLATIEYERKISPLTTVSLDYWEYKNSNQRDINYYNYDTNNVRVMFRYYSRGAFDGPFIGLGFSQLSHYTNRDNKIFSVSGFDFKIGSQASLTKKIIIGVQAGVTYYPGENTLEASGSAHTTINVPRISPNMGALVGWRF